MRILTWGAAAAVLLACAPVALAHEGSPNFLSQINEVTPAGSGLDVQVLNRDDRLLLINGSDKTVLIEGYEGEPYARLEPDGTVSVNKDSRAYYINEERDGRGDAGADPHGSPSSSWAGSFRRRRAPAVPAAGGGDDPAATAAGGWRGRASSCARAVLAG